MKHTPSKPPRGGPKPLSPGDRAIVLLRVFVDGEFGQAFKNGTDINGADFVDYGGNLYRWAKTILRAQKKVGYVRKVTKK